MFEIICRLGAVEGEEKRIRQSYRGKFLNKVMGDMNQIFVFLHVFLKSSTLFLL